VSAALTPPFLVAALLLCVAGALKLRSPRPAAAALRTLGLPGPTWLIRALAVGELALGAACAIDPTRAGAAVLAGAYVAFAGVAAALARRRVACGCFGEDDTPVSAAHWVASAFLGAVAAAAAADGSHGLGWVLGRGAPTAAVLLIGITGALYATVLVYTDLPVAWAAWSGE
jgi:hypothetical protein